jgi:hypothetical protein
VETAIQRYNHVIADIQLNMVSNIFDKMKNITPDVKEISRALTRIEGHVGALNVYGETDLSGDGYNI